MKSPYDIGKILEQMTLDLIASMRRNLSRHKLEETKEGFRWEMWQRAKLRSIAGYRRANRKVIRKAFKESEKLTEDVLKDSFDAGTRKNQSVWNRVKGRVAEFVGRLPIPQALKPKVGADWSELDKPVQERGFFGLNERKLEALQDTVHADLQKAQHGVLRKMDDVYRQTIYKAEVNMTAGAKTLNQAIDMATKDFLQKGINTIEYKDGRKVNVASYAEMALRTASQRATFLGEGRKRDEWGVYTVVMSAHANCSPMCLPYQGTVMIDDVYTSLTREQALRLSRELRHTLLSEAMENYAFHPNCRHSLSTFFPGISSVPEPVDDAKAVENYEAEQKQRYIERTIRMYKRLATGSLDDRNRERYQSKVKEWQGRMRKHISDNPQLRRAPVREVDRTA